MDILYKLQNEFVIFDGAMGTMLQKAGLKPGELPEQLNMTDGEKITAVHLAYLNAGAHVISANTFGANSYKLKKSGLDQEQVIKAALQNAKNALLRFEGPGYVAYDAGSVGMLIEPLGTLSFEQAYEMFSSQAIWAQKYGADLVLIETMSDIAEMRVALLAFKENCSLPVICSMTFDKNSRTLTGTNPATMANILSGLGADAIGANCSLGPAELYPVMAEIARTSKIPLIAQPNAGLPEYTGNGNTRYTCSVADFVLHLEKLIDLGVTIVGGCCGTDPEFITAIKSMLSRKTFHRNSPSLRACACSPSRTVYLDQGITIIGERINPTGNKPLRLSLKDGQTDTALSEAIDQKDAGAHILDVNVSVPGMDEVAMMRKLVLELAYIVKLPLQIDSTNPVVIENALRIYPGKAIINSVNGKESSMSSIFPIAKKYGAIVVCLCMDENGIPSKYHERLKIAEKIIRRAAEYKIPEQDLLLDCLVLTASAQQKEVMETLKAIAALKEKYDVKTVLGVSNVSYGLPKRELLNSTYLAMALAAGLDAAIIDPTSNAYMDVIRAFLVLSGADTDAQSFINYFGNKQAESKPAEIANQMQKSIAELIVSGNRAELENITRVLSATYAPIAIVEDHIVPALKTVGQLYEEGKLYLPQLIRAAETAGVAFAAIKNMLSEKAISDLNKGTVVLATVKGDVHDIGKNLVKVIMESYGYKIIDLGKDVDPHKVADTVITHNIRLLGLSALMTTTLPGMEQTIELVRQRSPECAIMVGGAVLTEQYAKKIGADFYCKDAPAAINVAEKVFSL